MNVDFWITNTNYGDLAQIGNVFNAYLEGGQMYQNWPNVVQMVLGPSSVVYVPEPIRALSDRILNQMHKTKVCYDFIQIIY